MRLTTGLVLAAGLAGALGQAHAQQTVYWNTGRTCTSNNNGTINFIGFSSGRIASPAPPPPYFEQRWSAQGFSIGAGGATIGQIDVEGWEVAGSEFNNFQVIVWNRAGGDPAPVAADQVATRTVPKPPTVTVPDARIAQGGTGVGTWSLLIPAPIVLAAGDYWLTVYADGSVANDQANFAWFANAQPDPVFYTPVNTPYAHGGPPMRMWRSTAFPSPGFEYYAPAVITIDPAPTSGPAVQDPDYLWSCAFQLKSPPPTGACCFTNGTCTPNLAQVTCTSQGGTWTSANTSCASANCPQPGACCKADGTCENIAATECNTAQGIYKGDNSLCANFNCATTGACCQLDGTCSLVNEASCRGTNGLYRGNGAACAAANCPLTYNYLGNPVAVPDGGVAGTGTQCGALAFASITVPDSYTIAAADVSLFVTHTWQGDTKFWLRHVPTNTRVQVINQPSNGAGGFGADNFGGGTSSGLMMRLVDSAPNFYRNPPVGLNGIDNVNWQWKPENALSGFNGENSSGEWQLEAQDCGGTDTGNIEYWVLALHKPGPAVCYANCDDSTTAPVLNVADFTCFLTKYASGALPYANCDNSTTAPVLNVADFTCFLTKYASGCP